MIGKYSYVFCKEDVSLIENYDKAMNDTTQTWVCHHRLEIELNLSLQELKEKNLYFNRPASELIFLTRSEHAHLHNLYNRKMLSIKAKEQWSDGAFKEQISLERRNRHFHHKERSKQLISISSSNRNWLNNGITRAFVKPEENEYYFERGYHLGFKL